MPTAAGTRLNRGSTKRGKVIERDVLVTDDGTVIFARVNNVLNAMATGVTITVPDAMLVPARLLACTLQVYGVPLFRPLTVIGDDACGGIAIPLQVTV